uniref:Uncharacterized protein n=1 Tax=Enterovibrio norvegicus TaxID=188144 RepID=A0A0H3ZWC6_9GAMM|nr:hypothetical protein [Enterovibrio norvegicus]
MKRSKLYRAMTFQDTILGLPTDYLMFMIVVCVPWGFGAALLSGDRHIGMIVGAALAIVLWLFGVIRAMKDPNFFDVLVTKLFKTSGKDYYEP